MIYHHINLACLSEIVVLPSEQEVFFADSLTLEMVAGFLGFSKPRVPGSVHLEQVIKNANTSLFLTARKCGFQNESVLPKFHSLLEIDNYDWRSFILPALDGKEITSCYLGISSPKQNIIAQRLNQLFPEIDYYCIGAILDADVVENNAQLEWYRDNKIEFLFHLKNRPRRTIDKLRTTFKFLIKLVVSPSFRVVARQKISLLSDVGYLNVVNQPGSDPTE